MNTDFFNLSHAQLRIWNIEQLYGQSTINSIIGLSRYKKEINIDLLRKAILLYTRNSSFRLNFFIKDNDIYQRYSDFNSNLEIPSVDFSTEEDPEAAFQSYLGNEILKPFDILSDEQLFRIIIFKLSDNEYGYVVNANHIITDGWSMQLMGKKVNEIYMNIDSENADEEIENDFQYYNYCNYENDYISSKRFNDDKQFWLNEFQEAPKNIVNTLNISPVGNHVIKKLDINSEKFKSFFDDNKKDKLFIFLISYFITYSLIENEKLITFGYPVHNRTSKFKDTFGMFTSTVPISYTIDENKSFRIMIGEIRKKTISCLRHQKYPFDILVSDLAEKFGNDYLGMFNWSFNYYTQQLAEIDDNTLSFSQIYSSEQNYPLNIILKEWESSVLEIEYDALAELYSVSSIEKIHNVFSKVLECIISDLDSNMNQNKLSEERVSEKKKIISITNVSKSDDYYSHFSYMLPFNNKREFESVRSNNSLSDILNDKINILSVVASLIFYYNQVHSIQFGILKENDIFDLRIALNDSIKYNEVYDIICGAVGGEKFDINYLEINNSNNDIAVSFDIFNGDHDSLKKLKANIIFFFNNNIEICYNSSIYSSEYVKTLLNQFIEVFNITENNKDLQLIKMDLLSHEDEDLIKNIFNNTDTPFPEDKTLLEFFEENAKLYPDKTAISGENFELSYSELNKRANQFARYINDREIKKNSIIPVVLRRSDQLMIAIYGVVKAGHAYLPIDPDYPKSRIDYIMEDCNAPLMVCASSDFENKICITVDYSALDNYSGEDLEVKPSPSDLAYVIYTSGSTGKPKGVMIEHHSIVNRLVWMQKAYPLYSEDMLLHKTPISFDVSLWELFWWGMYGASLHLLNHGDEKNPDQILDAINRKKVSVIHFVPSMLDAFLNYCKTVDNISDLLSSLKFVFASGEALQVQHVKLFYNIFSSNSARLINLYGPTEAAVDVSYFNTERNKDYERIPIGKPIDNIKLYVVNKGMNLAPIGGVGELCISGTGLSRGYYNNEKLTNERFLKNPFDRGMIYRTGDLTRLLPDGNIDYLGRIDNQVKIRGYRIELDEIEKVVNKCPFIQNSVINVINPKNDEISKSICAYVITEKECTEKDVKNYIAQFVPEYMVPSYVVFMNSFPLTPNGKIDRKKLPMPNISTREVEYKAPETLNEKMMVEIWKDVLNVGQIGVNDNFFSLGGDSIKFITILTRAKQKGITFNFKQLFEHPTIKSLLDNLDTHDEILSSEKQYFDMIKESDLEKINDEIEDAYPLSFLQEGLIYQSELNKGSSVYHDVFNYRMHGKFDADKFKEAVKILAQKHEIIRTSYHLSGYSQHIQLVHKEIPVPLEIFDLQGIEKQEQEVALKNNIEKIRNQKFEWNNIGLIKIYIHILNNNEYIYTLSFHDSALDGWSVNLLHTDLFMIYYSILNGKKTEIEIGDVRFRDFIKLEQKSVEGNNDKIYWQNKMKNYVSTKIQPWYNTAKTAPKIGYFEEKISKKLSDAIKNLAVKNNVPVKTILLSAHMWVLSMISGNLDVTSGYEYSGRPEDLNGEKILGLFLNTLPFRMNCESGTWKELIKKTYENELELIPHRRYPMMLIKNEIGTRESMFDAVFNFTHFHVLKNLQSISDLDFVDVRLHAETEFIFRAEFSQHPFTDDVLFWIHYHENVFTDEQIKYISSYYVNALERMCEDDNAECFSCEIVNNEELELQINTFNNKRSYIPLDRSYFDLFIDQANKTPNKTAVKFEGETITYKELVNSSARIADHLTNNGVKYQDVVCVLSERSIFWCSAVLGCMKNGNIYIPLSNDYPDSRIIDILEKSKCGYVITEKDEEKNRIVKIAEKIDNDIKLFTLDEIKNSSNEAVIENSKREYHSNELVYIIFTSGSTGKPKGVMIESRGMINHLYSKINELNMDQDAVIVQTASQCFDISIWQLLSALIVGGEVVIYPNSKIKEPLKFIDSIINDKITILEVVPSYLNIIINCLNNDNKNFPNLKNVLVTGEAVKNQTISDWFDLGNEIPLVNAYGPTEASDDITHFIMKDAGSSNIIPVGQTIQNMKIYILNKNNKIVPLGTKGEVCVAGIGVGRGYINDPEKTEAVFVKNPYSEIPYERMYRTGDVGRWLPNGTLELYGRMDNQVKVHGFRIEIDEIENKLLFMDYIDDAAIIIDDGNNDKNLVAFIVSSEKVDVNKLIYDLKEILPDYMIPSMFIQLDELPITSNGKVDKKALQAIFKEYKVEDLENEIVELKTDSERIIADVFAEVLNINRENIYGNSDFFRLGGHSLKAMEVAMKLHNNVSINDVFKYPLVSELALCMDSNIKSKKDDLLVHFSEPNEVREPKVALICFTYAGGNAINFHKLFKTITENDHSIEVYSVEYPSEGFDIDHPEAYFDLCAQKICDEIIKIGLPIYLWGHCSGNALMIETARLLNNRNNKPVKIFIGAKLIKEREDTFGSDMLTHENIKLWMINKTGFTGFDYMNEEESKVVTTAFLKDVVTANHYLDNITSKFNGQKLDIPVINVISDDDPLTLSYHDDHSKWNVVSDNLSLQVINGGGHYFNVTRTSEVSKIIISAIEE